MATPIYEEEDFKRCCVCSSFGGQVAATGPFGDYESAVAAARYIWLNKVKVRDWIESFAARSRRGATSRPILNSEEMVEWNDRYEEKFGFTFLSDSARSVPENLAELKRRYTNRPIEELEIAAKEEMKIIVIRLSGLYQPRTYSSTSPRGRTELITEHFPIGTGSRPTISAQVLDISKGSPAARIEVHLEIWEGKERIPPFQGSSNGRWIALGSSLTDSDGRSGALVKVTDKIKAGFYRIGFYTGNYGPSGFVPYVSIVLEVKQSQRSEHFHVPL